MKRNELMKSNHDDYIRVLEISDSDVLYINCSKENQIMPKWEKASYFANYTICKETDLYNYFGLEFQNIEDLSASDYKIANDRYSIITPVLCFLDDEHIRGTVIKKVASQNKITTQTIRNYLKTFLIFNNIAALSPRHKTISESSLTDDEKNMRWAINKFYYSRKKNSLVTAYKLMLKEKYADIDGKLCDEYPSYNQFRYFHYKNKNLINYYISRNGYTDFMRNNRVLIGDNVQSLAVAPGTAMADSTILDLYVVSDDRTKVIGRPILSVLVDAYSYLCLGYSISWEGGEYSLRDLMCNVISDKAKHCLKFGINISREEWPCDCLPSTIITDRGADYSGNTFSQLSDLNIKIVNLEGFRPDKKGPVEKFFDIIQNYFKPYLKGAGIVSPEYMERGSYFSNYKSTSCLTLNDIETILNHCIIHYNSRHLLNRFPLTEEMINLGIKPYSNLIWEYGIKNNRGTHIITNVKKEKLVLTLLPRTTGKLSKYGLKVNKLRYYAKGFAERCLKGGEVTVAYDKNNVSYVWLYEKGNYIRFELIETRFYNMDIFQVSSIKEHQKKIILGETHKSLQADIELINHIQTIKNNAVQANKPITKNIRDARKEEKDNTRVNHIKEAGLYD